MNSSIIHSLLYAILLLAYLNSCKLKSQDKYCGQHAPGLIPKVFAPEFISKNDRYEFGICFSKNGEEIFYGIDNNEKSEIHHSKLKKGIWSSSTPLLLDSIFSYNDPMLSPDENKLYFISDQSINDTKQKDIDIWYIERIDNGWSKPINAGTNINSLQNEYFVSFTDSNKMYFSSNKEARENEDYNFDIYCAQLTSDEYQKPIRISGNINTNRYEADVFIAPDESYIIYCSKRRSGLGKGDLYISYKDINDEWTPSVNMGSPINTKGHELCPFVSKDGKYFFYTSNEDIYWVSADILKKFKPSE